MFLCWFVANDEEENTAGGVGLRWKVYTQFLGARKIAVKENELERISEGTGKQKRSNREGTQGRDREKMPPALAEPDIENFATHKREREREKS